MKSFTSKSVYKCKSLNNNTYNNMNITNQCVSSGLDTETQLVLQPHSDAAQSDVAEHAPLAQEIGTSSMMSKMNVERPISSDTYRNDAYDLQADLNQFLKRRIRLSLSTWEVNTVLSSFNIPWFSYFSTLPIKKKLDNYFMLKGTMRITIYVSGTPFHIGMLLASYSYLRQNVPTINLSGDEHFITLSQKPHVYLNVASNKSAYIDVPFYFPYGFVKMDNGAPGLFDIGQLNLNSFGLLRQINAGTDAISVSTFGEMLDIKVAGPTMALLPLSSDSHEDFDAIFSPHSLASNQKRIPPPSAQIYKNHPLPNMAAAHLSDTSQVLTMGASTNIDEGPASVGLMPVDEMSIDYLTSKESYITTFQWSPGQDEGDTIFACQVDPMVERRSEVVDAFTAVGTEIYPTCLSMVSRPFSSWSGTLKFRFQVVSSQYHRGRLAIIYDPIGPLSTDMFVTTYHTIIDLAEGRDFTIDFPWQQFKPYQEIDHFDREREFYIDGNALSPTKLGDPVYSNGVFYVYVVNKLTVPDGSSDADILVSISAGDDFELMNPSGDALISYNWPPRAPGGGFRSMVPGEALETTLMPDGKSVTEMPSKAGRITKLKKQMKTLRKKDKEDKKESGSSKVKEKEDRKESTSSKTTDESEVQLEPHSAAVESTPVEENSPEAQSCTNPGQNILNSKAMKYKHFFGERVESIKDLCKRFTFYRTMHIPFDPDGLDAATQQRVTWILTSFPFGAGFDPNGTDLVSVSTGTAPFVSVGGSYMNYFASAFSGWRGSTRWKFASQADSASLNVIRATGPRRDLPVTFRPLNVSENEPLFAAGKAAYDSLFDHAWSGAGMAMTQCRTMDSLEVEIPYTIPQAFSYTAASSFSQNADDLYAGGDRYSLQVQDRKSVV